MVDHENWGEFFLGQCKTIVVAAVRGRGVFHLVKTPIVIKLTPQNKVTFNLLKIVFLIEHTLRVFSNHFLFAQQKSN